MRAPKGRVIYGQLWQWILPWWMPSWLYTRLPDWMARCIAWNQRGYDGTDMGKRRILVDDERWKNYVRSRHK